MTDHTAHILVQETPMTDTQNAGPGPITPVRCTTPDCPWAVHGIPDKYVGSRNDFLRRHLAEDHKPTWAEEEANAEDQPGYDGPTCDSYDRLQMWMDKSVPPADRDRLLDAFRDQVLTEAADELDRIADEAEARVAAHYGLAFGVGSAEMVRECARTVRSMAARTATAQEG